MDNYLVDENEYGINYSNILGQFDIKEADIKTISPLTFAFIGDCIYDLVIRSLVVGKANTSSSSLHKKKSQIVKAQSQRESFEKIESILTQDELDVYKRGRNAKTHTSAKNASKTDYHIATGFEALMGYLYMSGQTARMLELIKRGLEVKE